MSGDRRAIAFGLGAVALWSTVATAFKFALTYMSPLELMWIAAIVSWALMGALVVHRGLGRVALASGWKTAAWAGLMNPVAYYLVLFAAYDRLPGQEAMALNYTWALAMAFLAVPLLGQRLTRLDVLAGVIAYVGVWVIATRGRVFDMAFEDPLGVAFALCSTLIWALYWLLNARDAREPLVGQWQNFTIGLPVLTFLLLLGPGVTWHGWPALGAGVYVGLFEMGIAFIFWQLAVNGISRTAKVSNLIFLSPPVSLMLLHFVMGEPLLVSTFTGLGLILVGLALQQLPGNQKG
ncbi:MULTISPECIES: DMT family transporter [unclassified Halomonas]|uniref:DMT family transporter n=1 Tax=unclassified Halomonas TaxID=2609666 RepID=UPI0020A1E4E3|nr:MULTISPECIES: DMT family transporter [unclassified Halomonas]MCP1314637.1 DMT family transporter [Halomonas sp. 707D7]MCP1327379.1 DMT family transporter [Halomonas sp. 707D4]